MGGVSLAMKDKQVLALLEYHLQPDDEIFRVTVMKKVSLFKSLVDGILTGGLVEDSSNAHKNFGVQHFLVSNGSSGQLIAVKDGRVGDVKNLTPWPKKFNPRFMQLTVGNFRYINAGRVNRSVGQHD